MTDEAGLDVSARQFAAGLLLILVLAAALRFVYPTADAPWRTSVGVTWHDEGAWVHNARNKALFGVWITDAWNPVFMGPVFQALEYFSFRSFGVGLWQARLVSELTGLLAVAAIGLGVARASNRIAGLMAAAFLATTYVGVMFDRSAMMESSMTAACVLAWSCYACSARRPFLGVAAGLLAVAAFFTKAAAVAFVAALGLELLIVLLGWTQNGTRPDAVVRERAERVAAACAMAGLILSLLLVLILFLGPHWTEYRFYNWQTSVVRKPSYTLGAILDRASWFPIIHDFFTRLWLVAVLAVCAVSAGLMRFRRLAPGERLLLLWLALGTAELVLHDDGNERRFVMLIPPLVGLASIVLGHTRRLLPPEVAGLSRARGLCWSPVLLFMLYVIVGGVGRLGWLYEVRPAVRASALVAVAAGSFIYLTWPRVPRWLARDNWSVRAGACVALLIVAGNLAQFGQWALGRTHTNYEASVAIGRLLPPGTLVHGKLANGLSLESRIRPIFVGRGFGNYDDRLQRDDVRLLLTYVSPRLGYEGPVITEVLDAYPGWKILRTFDVAETPGGHDTAALIDKRPELGELNLQSGTSSADHR